VDSTATVITALGGAVGVVLGSWALVVKARGEAARPKQLLRRLWDWVETTSHHHEVPPTLAGEVREELEGSPPE
jgi:hypothetical protein